MGEVDPDLMRPPGLELAGQQRGDRLAVAAGKALLHLEMVTASRPPCAPPFLAAWGWRSIGASMVPWGRFGTPQANAM